MRAKIVAGVSVRDLLSANAAELWRYRRQLRGRLLDIMTRIRIFGQTEIVNELERQRP